MVARLNVAREVHLPGKDIGQVPREPDPVTAVELVVAHLGVQGLVQRIVDLTLDPDWLRRPGNRFGPRLPAVGGAGEGHQPLWARLHLNPGGLGVEVSPPEGEHQAGPESAGIEGRGAVESREVEAGDAVAVEQLAD